MLSVSAFPTGLTEVDELTTGFRDKEFYVVGASPGQGKTALDVSVHQEAAIARGHRPGVFSVEVPRTQIVTRLACQAREHRVYSTRATLA
jgi:replicative DNA helicase